MKKLRKVAIIVLSVIILISIQQNKVYADPNSSKGFAEYDDETAQQENQEMIQEQEQNFETIKSTNNYLESLEVEGYKLVPEFDKQTLEYSLDEKVETNEIIINAITSDPKAKVEGNGKVELQPEQNQCRIEVVAESGTVRTYIINFEKTINENQNNDTVEVSTDIQENETELIKSDVEIEDKTHYIEQKATIDAKIVCLIIITAIIILSMFIIYVVKRKKKK